eukprot:TRINITY_DN23861_c0_g1_i1.p2 TRINITY_DN23861_c0_g1~~TRINITY_DN23861_c0_g1_i1.p2  ORF type:complete len:138 (+),score=0.18 TRINITY_DN23861_c0_g1_i1:14-427(+)
MYCTIRGVLQLNKHYTSALNFLEKQNCKGGVFHNTTLYYSQIIHTISSLFKSGAQKMILYIYITEKLEFGSKQSQNLFFTAKLSTKNHKTFILIAMGREQKIITCTSHLFTRYMQTPMSSLKKILNQKKFDFCGGRS